MTIRGRKKSLITKHSLNVHHGRSGQIGIFLGSRRIGVGVELYPVSYCEHFVKYQGAEIGDCIRAPVQYFQDGYLKCTLKDRIGCEACAMGRNDKNIFDCQYMTDSGCNKLIEAKNRMLDAIASGAEIEPCERQCCAGCTRQCQYRCGVK